MYYDSRTIIAAVLGVAFLIAVPVSCTVAGSRNVSECKAHADELFKANGFDVIGYEGYNLDPFMGAHVWYTLHKTGDTSGTIYEAFLAKWGDEYHLYELKAIDAFAPKH